jgi:hypothetical protein
MKRLALSLAQALDCLLDRREYVFLLEASAHNVPSLSAVSGNDMIRFPAFKSI